MRTLSLGDRGTLVFYLQLALHRAGQEVSLDGRFGEETCQALGAFLDQSQGECKVDDSVWMKLLPYLKGYTEYTVKPGDTFWKIAEQFKIAAVNLQLANPDLQERFLPGGGSDKGALRLSVGSDTGPLFFPAGGMAGGGTPCPLSFYPV